MRPFILISFFPAKDIVLATVNKPSSDSKPNCSKTLFFLQQKTPCRKRISQGEICLNNIKNVTIFKKRIAENIVHQATSISTIYLCAIILSCAIMTIIEPFSLSDMLYETVSAVGTVGLSVGITAELTVFSKLLLILLMFFGRIGGLSLVLVLAEKQTPIFTERPVENILIG